LIGADNFIIGSVRLTENWHEILKALGYSATDMQQCKPAYEV
jgi:hypothetical protein